MSETLVKQHRYYWDDADHLIKLAREYQTKATNTTSETESQYFMYWKFRLARMSFIARMMSMESLLNNLLEEFSIPEQFKRLDLLANSFPRRESIPKNRRKRPGRVFQIPLKWKMYLTPYLCNDDDRMERDSYFIFEEGAYRKFRQLIMIRNEFVHTRMAEQAIDIVVTAELPVKRSDPIGKIATSEDFSDCCKDMGIDNDPVCFKIDNARVCGQAMKEIVLELNNFLDGRILTKDFWEGDSIAVEV